MEKILKPEVLKEAVLTVLGTSAWSLARAILSLLSGVPPIAHWGDQKEALRVVKVLEKALVDKPNVEALIQRIHQTMARDQWSPRRLASVARWMLTLDSLSLILTLHPNPKPQPETPLRPPMSQEAKMELELGNAIKTAVEKPKGAKGKGQAKVSKELGDAGKVSKTG